MTPYKVVIPARYASARLPGKPLLPLAGKPMILHVCERAASAGAEEVLVATDDDRILQVVESAGFVALMTGHHPSGTDRLAEVVALRGWGADTILVNLQGDEPLMPAVLLRQVAENLANHGQASIATLATTISDRETLFDPHAVKVVADASGFALYFSRAPIPWHRDEFVIDHEHLPGSTPFLRHVGLYAYRAGFLQRFVQWPPAQLELAESLEQLRALAYGEKIHVGVADQPPGHGVDTADDLARVELMLQGQSF
ncbi:MAG: 3-deoxy-manno-octulosonate cytidylyltransferase [Pseudomonadota bacterium]